MNRYTYTDEVRAALEGMLQPFAVYQLIENQIITILVSDGFCRMIGYEDREQAVWHLDHEMLKNIHAALSTRKAYSGQPTMTR